MSQNFYEQLTQLPLLLSSHVRISLVALGAGLLISIPLAVLLTRSPRFRYPVLTMAGVIQTFPSLALMALMVPLLDYTDGFGLGLEAFGFWPALIALTLYSILPMLRNTVTGIMGVDPAMTEAARGVGMTGWQSLVKVELPLAAPVIIAGIRTSTVWVVGIATLATPVGQKCLGNYIFTGLQTRNWLMVMFGVVGAAALAMLLDALIGGLEKAAAESRRGIGLACGVMLAVVLVAGLASPAIVRNMQDSSTDAAVVVEAVRVEQEIPVRRETIRIGAKTFTEQYILSELINRRLGRAGFDTRKTESLGSTIVFDALANNDVDVYIDYSGTIWANHMKREETDAPWKVLDIMAGWVAREFDIRSLGALGFENAYALAMRRDQAEKLGIRTIGDLVEHAPNMKIGGDYEFFGRPEWIQVRSRYGLDFAEQVSYDSSIMYEAVVMGQVDVISAFSSDGRISAFDLLVLDDPLNVIPPYDAVLLLAPRIAGSKPVVEALKPLIGSIDVSLMRRANHMVDREKNKKTVGQAAKWLDLTLAAPED